MTTATAKRTGDIPRQDWAADILGRVGAPNTSNNRLKLVAWFLLEGGHYDNTARFNPLNTTLAAPGAANIAGNSAGVKSYPDYETGTAATVSTILETPYAGIVNNLKSDAPIGAFFDELIRSPWDAAHYASSIGNPNDAQRGTIRNRVVQEAASAAGEGQEKGVQDVGLGIGASDIAHAVTGAVSGVTSAADLLGKLGNVSTWVHVAEVVGGFAAIGFGLYLIANDLSGGQVGQVAGTVGRTATLAAVA